MSFVVLYEQDGDLIAIRSGWMSGLKGVERTISLTSPLRAEMAGAIEQFLLAIVETACRTPHAARRADRRCPVYGVSDRPERP